MNNMKDSNKAVTRRNNYEFYRRDNITLLRLHYQHFYFPGPVILIHLYQIRSKYFETLTLLDYLHLS